MRATKARVGRVRQKGLKHSLIEAASELGPGVVTGAADDDPSGIATYSQAGAQFGYGLLWTMILTYPLMTAVQLVSGHIGRVTGAGLAKNLADTFPRSVVTVLVAILLIANIMNIGADLSAMAAATELVIGGRTRVFVFLFALLSVALQLFVPYHQYARVLKWLTLSLFAYVGVLLLVEVDWTAAFWGMIWPTDIGPGAIATVVAVLGTTISPYLFFWQSSQEAEDLADSGQRPLKQDPRGASAQFRRIRFDTFVGMAFSNLIALAIMIASAATLHQQGITQINTAAQAAEALRPIAGQFAFAMFALGIIGTGLLAVPVLAGSAAFAVSETRGWKGGLEYKPQQAARFYAIIVAATAAGVLLDWGNVNPIRALVWSAILNGVAAVPLMAAMMVIASRRKEMGRFVAAPMVLVFGWAATAVMAIATILFFASLI
ncbi:divalent metal cation transporter [Sphingomonas daechungensis]|uniref:NRAMP family divalent metal transporter n=1 Tax=Sphingomonas daechungensis TaxID=1176646 RepID=UPI0031ECD476